VRAYLARFPTPEDLDEGANSIVFGRPRAAAARRDAFSVFVSREAMARMTAHAWPGNQRELRLLATNVLVFCLTRHLDHGAGADAVARAPGARPPAERDGARAPAILDVPDPLIEQLLGSVPSAGGRASARTRGGVRRVEIDLAPGESFARVSAAVERQYLRALFEACRGDLGRMAQELLGPRGSPRQVHLRLNQLGLRLRDLRGNNGS
jgi:DNA-binding NtrC family response regulator